MSGLAKKIFVLRNAARFFFILAIIIAGAAISSARNITVDINRNNNNNNNGSPVVIKSIAILPFENFTNDPAAPRIMRELVKAELKGKGWVFLTKDDAIEEFLARRRIRYTNAITRLTAREMGKVLGVDAVFVGTVTQYAAANGTVVVGITARLLSTNNGGIIWADDLTYTGKDFEGILGLGLVKSLDSLAGMVAKDMIYGIADRFFIRETALSPFEIERVIINPTMARSGDTVEVLVKVLPVTDGAKDLRVMFAAEEILLEKTSEEEYRGKVKVPEKDGSYTLDVVATDSEDLPYVFEAISKVVVDNIPPAMEFALDKKIFSPKSRGSVVMEAKLLDFDEIEEWSVVITDGSGKRVRGDRGYGMVPSKFIWNGETDGRRALVEDGVYTVSLATKDPVGNTTVVKEEVRVKSKPPQIGVSVDVAEGIVLFNLVRSDNEPLESWKISVTDRSGNILKVLDGEGSNLPEKFEYPIGKDDDIRNIRISVRAKDVAGNVFEETKTVPSLFARRVPFAELKGDGAGWKDF
jgi:TolB-like protein